MFAVGRVVLAVTVLFPAEAVLLAPVEEVLLLLLVLLDSAVELAALCSEHRPDVAFCIQAACAVQVSGRVSRQTSAICLHQCVLARQ